MSKAAESSSAEGFKSPVLIPRGILFDGHCDELMGVCTYMCVV